MNSLPKVLLVGGPDVDARLPLMHRLRADFDLAAVGSRRTLQPSFMAQNFGYSVYRLSRETNPLLDLVAISQLAGIFRKLRPQIVHTFDTKPGVWGCLAARLTGVPIVVGTVTGLGSLYSTDGFMTRLLRSLYQKLQTLACRLSDRTIFQNYDDARQFIGDRVVSPDKAMVISGSGVPTEVFAPDRVPLAERARLRAELGFQPQEIVVTMVSRVIRSKGVPEFLMAAKHLRTQSASVRFLLVGPDDAESVDRLSRAELNELKQVVTWPGARRDITTVFASSDIFVLPSAYREGIPRVLLEAASMGLPIVTTNSPGCNDVVEHDVNGFLVPLHDSSALTSAISNLIDQPQLRLRFGEVSRQRAVERFDLSVVAAQTRSIYKELLARKQSRAEL
jgi:glycosyltransferase involved in cell wall biosynthesis